MSRAAAALKTVERTVVSPSPSASALDDMVQVEGWQPLLEEGTWLEAKFVGHDTAKIFNTGKLFLRFEVIAPGPYFGFKLFRPFRIRRLVGRPGPNGNFVLGARSDMYALLVRLFDMKLRVDRISLRELRHMLFRVRTRTVRTNHAGEQVPEAMHYSVIDRIERGE